MMGATVWARVAEVETREREVYLEPRMNLQEEREVVVREMGVSMVTGPAGYGGIELQWTNGHLL